MPVKKSAKKSISKSPAKAVKPKSTAKNKPTAKRKSTPKRKPAKSKRVSDNSKWLFIRSLLFKLGLIFEGKKWALPAHVYTRAMDVYVGQNIRQTAILEELIELGYQKQSSQNLVNSAGKYFVQGNSVFVFQRAFTFSGSHRESQKVTINWDAGEISSIYSAEGKIAAIRIEPRLFGSVSPLNHEDRQLITLEQTPQTLIDTLLAVEDRKFYKHFGVDPFGIARAMVRNVSAGRAVQGGSTLTQQLVKNYFLTSERTFKRKVTELLMSLILEIRYSKDEILQAYLNEVNLGQAGNRAIHGFGLGSEFIFGRPLSELNIHQQATLVGMVKGPSYYNPIRKPERSKSRRNLVLGIMSEQGIIEESIAEQQKKLPLNTLSSRAEQSKRSYASFTGYARDQLNERYQSEDLNTAGLSIFTTIDPRAQASLDKAIKKSFTAFSSRLGDEKASQLQVAAVSLRTDNGEVIALSGGKAGTLGGFNRALNAKRPIGSLVKPFVLLSAIQQKPQKYQLNTAILDDKVIVSQKGSDDWIPNNYDKKYHGNVMLMDALAKSYNIPFVKIGMDTGLSAIADTLSKYGLKNEPRKLPSLLLGSLELSPVEVSKLYLTLASGGFSSPITTVNSVVNEQGEALESFELQIQQVANSDVNNQAVRAMQEVFSSGTAAGLRKYFPEGLNLAGKSGTTDGNRDSWFAGFSGNILTVVWLGRDDNKTSGLTGSSGAGVIWSNYMSSLDLLPVQTFYSGNLSQVNVPSMVLVGEGEIAYDCSNDRSVMVSNTVEGAFDCAIDAWDENDDIGNVYKQKAVGRIGRFLDSIFN